MINLDRIVCEAVLRIGNLESDELYSKIVRDACIAAATAAVKDEREICAKIAEEYPGLDSVGHYVAQKIRARNNVRQAALRHEQPRLPHTHYCQHCADRWECIDTTCERGDVFGCENAPKCDEQPDKEEADVL